MSFLNDTLSNDRLTLLQDGFYFQNHNYLHHFRDIEVIGHVSNYPYFCSLLHNNHHNQLHKFTTKALITKIADKSIKTTKRSKVYNDFVLLLLSHVLRRAARP